MKRTILVVLSAGAMLVAFAAVPPLLPGSTSLNLYGSALAQKTPTTNTSNLNSSRSNIYRTKQGKNDGTAGIAVSDAGAPSKKLKQPNKK